MTAVLFVGQQPETVDFNDPTLPPGLTAEKIQVGIDLADSQMMAQGWDGDLCMISPDEAGLQRLADQLRAKVYDCVIVGAGLRLPPKGLLLFEKIINLIHTQMPHAAIAFNTQPEDTAEAAARWV